MRIDFLENLLQNPHKDLGLPNIDKIKGFSWHLMVKMKLTFLVYFLTKSFKFQETCQEQKTNLINTANNLFYLKRYIIFFTEFSEESHFIQTNEFHKMTNLFKNIIIVMDQYKIILDTCPEKFIDENQIQEMPILTCETSTDIYKNNEIWNKVIACINGIIHSTNNILSILNKVKSFIHCYCDHSITPSFLPIYEVDHVRSEVNVCDNKLKELLSLLEHFPLSNSLKWLINEFEGIKVLVLPHHDAEKINKSLPEFKLKIEKVIGKCLCTIQNIYKRYDLQHQKMNDSENASTSEETCELLENHLKSMTLENLYEDISKFKIKTLLNEVKNIVNKVIKLNPSESTDYRRIVTCALPLFEQLALLYQYFMTQQVCAYRVTCKLSSILFNIFINLSSKVKWLISNVSNKIILWNFTGVLCAS